jgi:hypothetical protein
LPGVSSDQQPEHLFGRNRQQAEGQVRGYLDRAAHAHVASAVFVVQVAVDALGGTALAIFARLPPVKTRVSRPAAGCGR